MEVTKPHDGAIFKEREREREREQDSLLWI